MVIAGPLIAQIRYWDCIIWYQVFDNAYNLFCIGWRQQWAELCSDKSR
jgi:hypothetical protein